MFNPPVVALIGMRGAGKTTLGRGVAEILGFDFDDLDEVITRTANGKLPPEIVKAEGWEAFRKLEADCFQSTAAAKKAKVIACGGGIIETDRAMDIMRSHHPVILIDRHIDDVITTLEGDPAAQVHRASLGEHPRDTYKRRLPKYEEVANFRFPIAKGEKDLASLTTSFARFVNIALGRSIPSTVSDSFFISLTAADYSKVAPEVLRSAASNADTLEFRVDLLENWEPENVVHQAALIRRCAPGTPLLYTVRSKEHGGKFDGSEDQYFKLNFLGLQLCAELLDVECTWSQPRINELVQKKGPSLLVGSYHNFGRMLSRSELEEKFKECMLSGAAAIAKVVVKAEAREDNWIVQEVGNATTANSAAFIGLCLGEAGKLSRVLNQVMCPSMHPDLAPGAPGQMSVKELLEVRQGLGLMGSSRQFAVIGPWGDVPAASFYVGLLQAIFRALQLPHVAVRDFARSSEEALRLLSLASTGGAVLLGPLTSQLASESWADVSYVDCVARRNGKLTAHCCKSEMLKNRLQHLPSKRTALVLGDAAACLAGLRALKFQRIVATVACESVEALQDLKKVTELDAVIYMGSQLEKLQSLTEAVQSMKPIVVDMSIPMDVDLCQAKLGCEMISSDVFLSEEVLAWLRTWHIETNAEVVKQVVAEEVAKWRNQASRGQQAWT